MPFGNSSIGARLGTIRAENPIRRPEKQPSGGLSVTSVGPQLRDAITPLRHPTRISAPPGGFSVCRAHGLLQGFLRERARAVSVAGREFPCGRPPHPKPAFPQALQRFSQPCSESSWVRLLSDQPHPFGRKLLRKRTIASGGSHAPVGKPQRKRQKSPQVTDCHGPAARPTDRVSCGFPRRLACERRSSFWPNTSV